MLVSAGAFGSPAILERSGIGSSELLNRLQIEAVVALPGVGDKYQGGCAYCSASTRAVSSDELSPDHQVVFAPYLVRDEAETLDGIVRGDPDEVESSSISPVPCWPASTKWSLPQNGMRNGSRTAQG